MILAAIIGLVQSIFYDIVLFYLGQILSNSKQLRNYLGLKSSEEKESDFEKITYLVEKIGELVMIIAVVSVIVSVVTTITVLSNM